MDAAELDYPNGSELGEIFAALESLKQELQVTDRMSIIILIIFV